MRTLLILAVCSGAAVAGVTLTHRVDIEIGGRPFTSFYMGADGGKPYLHPLRAPSGTIVTRQYPMAEVPGESRDHPHHRGLWFTHGDVNGIDFWANAEAGATKGRVVFRRFAHTDNARLRNAAVLAAEFAWEGPGGRTLLDESRVMTFYDEPALRTIDFDITLTAREKVVFGDTKEGTFAIRLADAMTEKNKGGNMKNASGATGMKNVWGKPSPWVDYSGTIAGEKLGVAIFDHPGNPKHPTFWHARDYGLFGANIFGEHDFFADKSRNGSITLRAGEKLRFRYRVVIHPGDTEAAGVEKLYRDYVNLTRQP